MNAVLEGGRGEEERVPFESNGCVHYLDIAVIVSQKYNMSNLTKLYTLNMQFYT